LLSLDAGDSSPSQHVGAHCAILSDAKTAMQQMIERLGARQAQTDTPSKSRLDPWWQQIEMWKARAPLVYFDASDKIKPQQLCEKLDRMTGGDAIIATDVGQHQMWIPKYYGFRRLRRSLTSA